MDGLIYPVAKRRMNFNGKRYRAGQKVPMEQAQYDTNMGPAGIGWVELPPARAPRATKGAAKPAA